MRQRRAWQKVWENSGENDMILLYNLLHRLYNKRRNLLKTGMLRDKRDIAPSSPPHNLNVIPAEAGV